MDRFDNETQYASFLKPEALRSLTLATNIGNHDSNGINYQEHFNLPNESSSQGDTPASGDYWYSYNGVLFLSLNSNNMSTAEHKEFMSSAIRAYQAANNGAEPLWKIVTFHHSIYSTASHMEDGDIIQRRNGLPQVFKELDIDVVLQGHDHVYTRTYMMDGGAVSANENYTYASGAEKAPTAVTAPSGILYVTANSASGSKYYDLHAGYNYNWAAVRDQSKKPSISKATVSENTFTITTYNVNDMSVLDTFTINKTAQQPPSTDAALSALTVTGATITPAFSADTLVYTASVANSVTSVTIAATADGSKAVVTGNVGVKALSVGENTFTVTATAEDGSTTKSYAVTIVRAAASGGSSSSSSSQYTIRAEAHHFCQRIHPRGEGRWPDLHSESRQWVQTEGRFGGWQERRRCIPVHL